MTWIIAAAVGLGVTALIVGVAMLFRTSNDTVEDRLDQLAGLKRHSGLQHAERSLLSSPLDDVPHLLERYFGRIGNIRLLLAQADVEMQLSTFGLICLALALAGAGIVLVFGMHILIAIVVGAGMAVVPVMWLMFLRQRRFKQFGQQLPEALELMARGLRAGHSLQAGFQLVGEESAEPLSTEFLRVFEEQNLGVTMEESLMGMTERVPNLDLKFFATAVILQRSTGGDLAEILDKIGSLIRDRFRIFGQIQALTGEGRLSGIVLLALAPVLYLVMLKLNYEYAMVLFEDEMGRKMMAFTVGMQLLGAFVIKKIVNIKV